MEEVTVKLEGKDIPLVDLIEYIRKEVEDERGIDNVQINKNILFCIRQWGTMCLEKYIYGEKAKEEE